jgi:hypothetical protein
LVLDYLLEGNEYVADEGDDSLSNQAGAEIIKTFSRRFSASLGYRFEDFKGSSGDRGVEDDFEAEDFQRHDAFGTVVYEVSPQFSLNVRGGMAWIDFDERDNTDSTLWGVGIEYFPSILFSANLNYTEDFESSVENGLVNSKRVSLLLSYLGRIPVSLEFFHDKEEYEEEDRDDDATGGVLTATIPFGTRLSLLVSGNYTYSEFDPDGEEVDDYGGRASLEYVTRYITFLLSHSYQERDSNFDEEDYTNNITTLSARMEF